MSESNHRRLGAAPTWQVLFDTIGFEESDLDLDAIREAAKDPDFEAKCEKSLASVIDALNRMPRTPSRFWMIPLERMKK